MAQENDKKILRALKSVRDKTQGREKDAIAYQINQIEEKAEQNSAIKVFKSQISSKRMKAKIFREQNRKVGLEKMIEIDEGQAFKLLPKLDLCNKILYFLMKQLKSCYDEEEDPEYDKTNGNVGFSISEISINPAYEPDKIFFNIDSETKFTIKPDFKGEFNIPLVNSKEFELIVLGKKGVVISILFFPCEYFISHDGSKDEIFDLQDGFIKAKIKFEREIKLIRKNAEIFCVYKFDHGLQNYHSSTPFFCCVCDNMVSLFSNAYRCYKCTFTCHKRCSDYILFKCPCSTHEAEGYVKRYNIPHNLVDKGSKGLNYCSHCGSRIPIGDVYSSCSKCASKFHSECSARSFKSCGISHELRCLMAEFNPPKPEPKKDKLQISITDFSLVKVLGRGSFGKVMLAKHNDGTKIALKILKKENLVDANEVTYIELERKVLQFATLSKFPFLMQMLYCFQDSKHIYFGTEFLSGGDLFHHAAKGEFSQKRILLYAAEILLGLEYLHKNNIIYRDMKLDNILLASDGHVKIADFGLCKDEIGPFAISYTYCGTPDTIAPEVIKQCGYTRAVDWWSYGVVLYEMFESEPLFNGATNAEMAIAILHNDFSFKVTPPDAQDLIRKLLVKDPEKRLGYGLGGIDAIKEHPYFKYLKWEDVLGRRYKPDYIPEAKIDSNFDKEFIDEAIHLTPCNSIKKYDRYFTNFK